MTIGERIRARRIALQMSQKDLADKLGYSNHSTVARAESGKLDLPQSRLAQYADVLGVSVGHLMGLDERPDDFGALAAQVLKDPALLQLVQDFQTLDGADRATVCALVSSLAAKKKD
jgi:transcriptional regulator with XRE-family HTH domain